LHLLNLANVEVFMIC